MLNTLVIRTTALGVLAAGGILFAMDSGLVGSAGNAQTQSDVERTLTSDSRTVHSLSPDLPEIVTSSDVRLPMSAEPVAPEALLVPTTFDMTPDAPEPVITTDVSDLGLPCDVSLSAMAMPAAMVALDLMAPCRPEAGVRITHSGMTFDLQTGPLGLLTLDIPAFETPASFSVTFDDGFEQSAQVGLPDLRDFDRIGLTWRGDMGLELHAMEFGAAFGGDGHVWRDAPAAADAAIAGDGGFLTEIALGEGHAQIYTLPRATLREGEGVRLSIDAPITANNCAASVLARTLRAEGAGPVDITELSFTMPGCDAIGDVLVLQNLLDDLRLAAN